jgi:putative phage-type endonuclease
MEVTDSITFHDMVTTDEQLQLIETAGDLICQYIFDNPMIYIEYNFYDMVYTSVKELMTVQFKDLFFHIDDYDLTSNIEQSINYAFKLFFTHIAPRRSFKNTFIRKLPNHTNMKSKIDYLLSVPQPPQRTTEWYEFRHKYLTASSIWKAFISPSTRNQLIYSKCCPINVDKYKTVNISSPLHWGQKYEDLSIKWYEFTFNTKVGDFGCIPHKELSFLAASPDGINIDPSSPRYGRMVEVKNIVNREITGIPKTEYWIQMQIQMEVCNLNECDFLECRFIEYESQDDFLTDGSFNKTSDGKEKGIIIMFLDDSNIPKYIYPPWNLSESEFDTWESDVMNKYSNLLWAKNIYWRLDQVSCVLVIRNKFWFNFAKPILIELWNTIENEKKSGYEHRAPNKRIKKTKQDVITPPSMCFIDVSTLHDIVYNGSVQSDVQNDVQSDVVDVSDNANCGKKQTVKTSEAKNIIINISTEVISKK